MAGTVASIGAGTIEGAGSVTAIEAEVVAEVIISVVGAGTVAVAEALI